MCCFIILRFQEAGNQIFRLFGIYSETNISNKLTEAKQIQLNDRTDKASRDLMTTEQRDTMAEDFATKKQFLSASHFISCADK